MESESHRTNDERVQRLFDDTAARPTPAQLRRMAQAAARAPAAPRPSAWTEAVRWLRGHPRPVAAAVLAATGVAAAVTVWTTLLSPPLLGQLRATLPRPALSVPAERGSTVTAPWDDGSWEDLPLVVSFDPEWAPLVETDPLSVLDGAGLDWDPDVGFDLLHPPGDDVDADLWAEIVDGLLEDT